MAVSLSRCVTLNAETTAFHHPAEVVAEHRQITRIDGPQLRLVDVSLDHHGSFSARLIKSSMCRVEHVEDRRTETSYSTDYPGRASPWVMLGAELALSGATLFESGLCYGSSSLCTGVTDKSAAGALLAVVGAAAGVVAGIDTVYLLGPSTHKSDVAETSVIVATSIEPCKADTAIVANQVGTLLVGKASRYFMTDATGRFVIEGVRGDARALSHVQIELRDETSWIDLASTVAR